MERAEGVSEGEERGGGEEWRRVLSVCEGPVGWEDHRWHTETGVREKGVVADVKRRVMKDTGERGKKEGQGRGRREPLVGRNEDTWTGDWTRKMEMRVAN